MSPFEFLEQEFENVREALNDSLRHDYGPAGSDDYFKECSHRLSELHQSFSRLNRSDHRLIADKLVELDAIASWISLIERSHLGEFSWPFANALRQVATKLLAEVKLRAGSEPSKPIVHIIGGGENYEIRTEGPVSAITKDRRFVVVSFPRSLKHHVLLHALFGHELGHAVIHAVGVPGIGQAFEARGPMKSAAEMTNWLDLPKAPAAVRRVTLAHRKKTNSPVIVQPETWVNWVAELSCDLIGLVLFCPAFAAATCTFLRFREKHEYLPPLAPQQELAQHPPYACRHKLLVQALKELGWNRPITKVPDGAIHRAEVAMLGSILDDPYDPWAGVLDGAQVRTALQSIRSVLAPHGLNYTPPSREVLNMLVGNLAEHVPPVAAEVLAKGELDLRKVGLAQVLHAGWLYWLGRKHFAGGTPTFLETNRLCHLGLIQNDAVQKTVDEPQRTTRYLRNSRALADHQPAAR